MRFQRSLGLILVALCQFSALAAPRAVNPTGCENFLDVRYFQREFAIEIPRWSDDVGLIKADLEAQAWSSVRTYFSKKWDTQVYYTATGVPNRSLEVPLVDPDCKAVVFFVHGSGTGKSSGSNFISNMSWLSNYGYCGVSVDLPFHASGSLRDKLSDGDAFMAYIRDIILEIKSHGKPVYLAGHSFGPDVIFELVSRNPYLVEGALAMSPAGFTSVLNRWYEQRTLKMKFGGVVTPNTLGEQWASHVTDKFRWSSGQFADPTVVNPGLKLRVLSGDREEYVPAPTGGPRRTPIGPNTYDISRPLQKIFSQATITIEKGVGHYLFDFKDPNGVNVVQRELLLMLGEDPLRKEALREEEIKIKRQREARPSYEVVAVRSQIDFVFRSWFVTKYDDRVVRELLAHGDQTRATRMLKDFEEAHNQRLVQISQLVFNTEKTHPDFYAQNRERIEKSKQAILHRSFDYPLFALFYVYLNKGASVSVN